MNLKTTLMSYLKVSEIKDNAQAYVDARLQLAKMDIEENAATAMAEIVYAIFKITAGSLLTLLFLIILAVFINQKTDSQYLGYLISFAIAALVFVLIYFNAKSMKDQIKGKIMAKIEAQ